MNPKLQKLSRDIERTKAKIAELEALLPQLEQQKTELENVELIKLFRTADISPDNFSDFVAAYRAQGGAPKETVTNLQVAPAYSDAANHQNHREETEDV